MALNNIKISQELKNKDQLSIKKDITKCEKNENLLKTSNLFFKYKKKFFLKKIKLPNSFKHAQKLEFWRKYKKLGRLSYRFCPTNSGSSFFWESIRNFGIQEIIRNFRWAKIRLVFQRKYIKLWLGHSLLKKPFPYYLMYYLQIRLKSDKQTLLQIMIVL